VPYHICIGEIHDDGVEVALFHGMNYRICNASSGHFRFQIVSRHFGRRNQDAFLSGERLFDAAVEEIGDVRIFFGLRDAQILKT
jgi:hypothetical protein